MDTIYVLPKNNNQFKFLLSKYNSYYKLCMLICKFINIKNNYQTFLYNLLKPNKTDEQIYIQIKKNLKKINYNANNIPYLKYISKHLHDIIISIYPQIYVSSYLDFGCGKCEFAEHFGETFNLDKEHIYATDVKEIFEENWSLSRIHTNIQFDFINQNKIPFSIKFDIITCFMVLHHIANVTDSLVDIKKHMKKNGLLIIKEHNCETTDDKLLADIMHSLYILENKEKSDLCIKKIKKQKYYYKSKEEWKKIIEHIGFKEVYSKEDNFSSTKNYISIFVNIS